MQFIIKYLKVMLAFLLPIVAKAAAHVAADELTKYAGPRPTPRTVYAHKPPTSRLQATRNVGRAVREARAFVEPGNNGVSHSYHDVVMVAFDLKGDNIEDAHNWLMDNLPEPGTHGDKGEIYLDSWWVANDERFDRSDCDSAVFVTMGNQKEAREVLWKAGLSSEYGQRS